MTPEAFSRARSQTRALVWEEARVGGVIALWLALVGLGMLAAVRLISGVEFWLRDDQLPYVVGFWIPVAIAFLLVLSPDHSGNLGGGFSKRILRFPVATPHAVAVSLISRLVFLGAASFVLTGVCTNITDGEPGFGVIFVVALVYIAAQLLDWLRGPVSGLATLALFLAAFAIAAVIIAPESFLQPAFRLLIDAGQTPGRMAILGLAAAIVTYAVALVAVRADRTGRSIGFPDVWEWRLPLTQAGATTRRPLRTPLTAQVWFEIRRSRALLPIITLCAYALIVGLHWLAFAEVRGIQTLGEAFRDSARWSVFVALGTGVVAHAIQTRIIGLRRSTESPGFEYLQPLTDAQFALSRVVAGLILLVPTIAVVLAIHYLAAAPVVVFEIVPASLREGFGSLREVVWVFLGRGLFVALIAWVLLAISTRLFRRLLTVALLLVAAALISDYLFDTTFADILHSNFITGERQDILTPLVLGAVAFTLMCAVVTWRRGQLSRFALIGLGFTWLLAAWLLRYVIAASIAPDRFGPGETAFTMLIALGYSAPIPLVYFALLFDIARRRRVTRTALVTSPESARTGARRIGWRTVAAVSAAIAVLWLGWPAQPSYVRYFHAKGYPATLRELDEWYVTPPPAENDALAYQDTMRRVEQLDREYETFVADVAENLLADPALPRGSGYSIPWENVYILGGAYAVRDELLYQRAWDMTELYWQRVTSKIVPTLHEIGDRDRSDSRYPIDLEDGYEVQLPHLARARHLSRQLAIDSLYWTVHAQPANAVDSAVASFALTKSLTNEPILISQLVRIALLGVNVASIESILNRSVPSDADLLRLQRACESAYPAPGREPALARSMVGEAVMALHAPYFSSGAPIDAISAPSSPIPAPISAVPELDELRPAPAQVLLHELAFPRAATWLVVPAELNDTIAAGVMTHAEVRSRESSGEEDERFRQIAVVAPTVRIMWPALGRAFEAEWRARTTLDLAQVAIAVERFRLAHDRLPSALDELVPEFITSVPEDYFAGPGVPIKYRARESGEFVVYSVGRDAEDDLGVEMERWWQEGDLTFTVAPLSVRMGPKVTAARSDN